MGTAPDAPNRYGVVTHHDDHGWRVGIVDARGREVASRACGDEGDARTYASIVLQHVEWLSEAKFREYYRIAGGSGGLEERADQASGSPPFEQRGSEGLEERADQASGSPPFQQEA